MLSILAAVGGLPSIGTRPGTADKAVYDAAEDYSAEIAEVVRGNQRAVEVAFDDDVPDLDDTIDGGDSFYFDVMLLIHLPDALLEGSTYSLEAVRAHTDVVKLYSHPSDPTIGTWNGRAVRTDNMGGGGVSFSGHGTRCVASVFRVHYRHKTGDPLEAV